MRDKPLADATCRRIAKGIMRYVVEAEQPFIVPGVAATLVQTGYGERPGQAPRVPGLDKPLGTVVAGQKHALVQAFLTKFRVGSTGTAIGEPVHTVTAGGTPRRPSTGNTMGLVAANLIHMGHGEGKEGGKRWSHGIRDVKDPLNTITAQGAAAGIVTSHMVKLRGQNVGAATDEPVHTISAQGTHHGEVRAFLVKYYGNDKDGQDLPDPLHTIPTRDRFGLVMVKGEPYAIVDIGLRMLTPRELYRAQGFPDSYVIDTGAAGEPITKTAQVRMCGNSVCPPLSHALVKANYCERQALRIAA